MKHIELFENFFDREEPLNEGVDFKALGFIEIQKDTFQKKTKDYDFIMFPLDDGKCTFSITVPPGVEEKKFPAELNVETKKLNKGWTKYISIEAPQEKIAEAVKILDSK